MRQFKEKLLAYIADHPVDFGTSDAESILSFLYDAYCESHECDPPETKNLFAQLGEYLEQLPLETNNAMFFIIVKLCTEHERRGFTDGVCWGMQLATETGELSL